MVKKIAIFALIFVVAAAVVFTGCTPARRPFNNNQNYSTNVRYQGNRTGIAYENYTKAGDELGMRDWDNNFMTGRDDGRVGYNNGGSNAGYNNNTAYGNNTGFGNNIGFGNNVGNGNAETRRADQLARTCEQVTGVDDATVVVTGNTAYVGIDLDTTNAANERDIKNQVAQKIRAEGNDINTVYVSAEMDFMDRLRNVGNGMRNGRPIDAFTTELNEMVQRIMPTRW